MLVESVLKQVGRERAETGAAAVCSQWPLRGIPAAVAWWVKGR